MGGYAAAGGAVLGGIAGGMKSGKDRKVSELERQAQMYSQQSLNSFAQLAAAGPGMADYTKGVQSQRDLGQMLQNYASSGLYDFGKGNQIASQAYAGQRTALAQAFQDQLQSASKSAQLAGRSSNDPILRAKLAQEQMRQSALLDANQSAAAVDFGRQFSLDRISNATASTQMYAGLGNQALTNQQHLFQMGQMAYQTEHTGSLQDAMYDMSRGGGFKGAITGALAGAGAGMQAAQGFSAMNANNAYADKMSAPATDRAGGTTSYSTDYLSMPEGAASRPTVRAPVGRPQTNFSFVDEGFGGSLDGPAPGYGNNFGPASPPGFGANYGPRSPAAQVYGPPSPPPQGSSISPNWWNNLFR